MLSHALFVAAFWRKMVPPVVRSSSWWVSCSLFDGIKMRWVDVMSQLCFLVGTVQTLDPNDITRSRWPNLRLYWLYFCSAEGSRVRLVRSRLQNPSLLSVLWIHGSHISACFVKACSCRTNVAVPPEIIGAVLRNVTTILFAYEVKNVSDVTSPEIETNHCHTMADQANRKLASRCWRNGGPSLNEWWRCQHGGSAV